MSPHLPRCTGSPGETEAKTRRLLGHLEQLEYVIPVHYQEPFRRGFRVDDWEPAAAL